MPKSFLFAFYLLCLLIAGHASSVQVEGIYSATVPLDSQRVAERDSAFDAALLKVVVKVSGQPALIENASLLSALLPAQRYVQTFSYRENPAYKAYQLQQEQLAEADKPDNSVQEPADIPEAADETEVVASEPEIPAPFLMDVTFSKTLVDSRLNEWQIPVWGDIRPSLLMWVAFSEDSHRQVLASTHPFAQEILAQAEALALPVFLPVMDLTDVTAVAIDDLWGLFPDAVEAASARYRPDTNLLMRLSPSQDGLWSARWSLLLKREVISAEIQSVNREALWQAVLEFVSTEFSQRYAVRYTEQEAGSLALRVAGVKDFASYAQLRDYLRSLPPVASAEPTWLDRNSVSYRIRLNGSEQQFMEFLELGGKLTPVESPNLNSPVLEPALLVEQGAFNAESAFEPSQMNLRDPVMHFEWRGGR